MEKSKPQFKIKNFYFLVLVLPFYFLLFTLFGCASVKEKGKCFLGVSTKELEEGRKDAISKTFPMSLEDSYLKTQTVLKDSGAYIFAKRKDMLAIYLSEEDTTPVGIFFKEVDAKNTQIEVSSPSTFAKELISTKIFAALEGKTDEK